MYKKSHSNEENEHESIVDQVSRTYEHEGI